MLITMDVIGTAVPTWGAMNSTIVTVYLEVAWKRDLAPPANPLHHLCQWSGGDDLHISCIWDAILQGWFVVISNCGQLEDSFPGSQLCIDWEMLAHGG